ncbi:MAG TPA: Fe-S cluster assembly protein SufD [Bryobacteraceae bacterium]|jgi:Fe-S cluster assembly protein SufD|nr:Fe-S cluster assembly protein SufD [Bryobacteraceae bacterium]
MTAVSEQIGVWLEQFTKQPKAERWVQELREAAFRRFTELGFPTTHDEEWRFTNVAPIARAKFVELADALPRPPEEARAYLARHASYETNAFVALNTAFINGVRFARVPSGKIAEQPIEISCAVGPGQVYHPRAVVVVGTNAHCTIVETYKGTGSYFTNAVTEIVAGEGAVVDHYKVQEESREAFHIATMQVTLGRSANFTSHSIAIGGALVRNDANVTLSEGTEATLNGLYIVNGKQHVDNHTQIDHAKPHGTSHELYKGILDDKASAVFNGRIIVRKDAQKTDSKQTNKNLVLSDDAVIDTKPELQILADDVRCTHGATIGQLDAEALFYLQSRGIGKSQARDVLTYAFAQDIINRVKVPALKDHLEKVLFEKFHERSE